MSQLVIYRDRQEINQTDLNNMGKFSQAHTERVISGGIGEGYYYYGLNTTEEDNTTIRIESGAVWALGKIYIRPEAVNIGGQTETYSVLSYLPATFEKVLAIIGYGQDIETDVQARDFMIDIQTEAIEPQSVPMQALQLATVQLLPGSESPAPEVPPIPSGAVHFCNVYLNSAGIDRIEMVLESLVPNAAANSQRILDLELKFEQLQSVIEALITKLSELDEIASNPPANREQYLRLATDIARLKERVELPDTYSQYGADVFTNRDETLDSGARQNHRIEFGMNFPIEAESIQGLQLLNPSDALASVSAQNQILPAYTEVQRYQTKNRDGDMALSFESQTFETKSYTVNEWVHAKGWSYQDYVDWWTSTWNISPNGFAKPIGQASTSLDTYAAKWTLEFTRYWSLQPTKKTYVAPTTTNIVGALVAQTFVCPSSMWITSVGVHFTGVDSQGNVTLILCETLNGKPALDRVVSRSTVSQGLLVSNGETRFELEPAFLNSGRRYAIAIVSQGAHRIATASGEVNTEGTLFFSTSGDFFEGDLTKDLFFSLYAAKFNQVRTEVALQPLTLAGGIDDILMSPRQLVPEGAGVMFEVQYNGAWVPFNYDPDDLLSNQPDVLPLRAVMFGTSDVQPALWADSNVIRSSRSGTLLDHESENRLLDSASSEIIVKMLMAGFDASAHEINIRLWDDTLNSVVNPDSITYEDIGGGATLATATFTPSNITDYRIIFDGQRGTPTEDNSVAPFSVVERIDVAL